MQTLTTNATEIFKRLITMANSAGGHIKIQNDLSFMAVCVEKLENIYFGKFRAEIYSIAHYGEQNGDLMSDPDMTFIYVPEIDKVYPSSITNHYAGIYRESIFLEDGKWMINKKEQKDQAIFASQWMKNIKDQQGI